MIWRVDTGSSAPTPPSIALTPELLERCEVAAPRSASLFRLRIWYSLSSYLKLVTHLAAAFVKEKDAVAEIIPRWEWCSFGRRFGDAELRTGEDSRRAAFRTATRSTCFPARGENVKIRDALVDVKVMREVNADGLEQWTPVMKAGFHFLRKRSREGAGGARCPDLGATTQQLHARGIP